ncbi:MAG: DNA-formamidopyrimidine glycosylase family protein [Pedobacter sp.]|jgi:endonuclease-8|uniref:DNA-formamidopyrimidine glycosylase family protein n=1 Tax=Pedobacter sp. TaxID=1411316 RepID=UPI003568FE3E
MPEGPSIVILRELIENLHLEGSEIIEVAGNTKLDKDRLLHQKVIAFKSWGKHFLICFNDFVLRIHFMLFGSYRINERKESAPRISLVFKNDELNFYTCSLQFIEGDITTIYNWEVDVLSDDWNPSKALKTVKEKEDVLVCDILLDQNIFSGVGNIIKNEVLYRVGVHPLSTVGSLSTPKLKELIKQARNYSFDFLHWKKEFTLKKHWLVYSKKLCPKNHPITREHLGKTNRLTFYCAQCQNYGKR